MKTQFKILVLMLITSAVVYAQKPSDIVMDEKHTIYKENFSTNESTTLVLNLNNTKAQIFESPDDKVYIEYTKEFKNTKKKRIQSQLKLFKVSGKKEGNKITYSSKTRSALGDRRYRFEELMINRLQKKKFLKDSTQKPIKRKSLDSVFYEIKASDSLFRNRLYGTLKIKPHVKKWKKSDQIIITKMIIKIPKNIHVRATLENSNLVFIDDFYNRATMNVRNTKLKFKSVGNALSIFDIDNGYFNAVDVTSGSYSFANVRQVRIGKLKNTSINSEFTKVEIGEIGKKVEIVDFTSKYLIHNFSKGFGNFKMNTEYSEINLFFPEDKEYYIDTFGHDTFHRFDGVKGAVTTSLKNESTKMLVIGKETNPNKIRINTVHGIVRLGEDFINLGE